MTRDLNGYSMDIPYLRDFKPMLAPAWLDHVALVAGVEPPVRTGWFCMVRPRLRPGGHRRHPCRDPSDRYVPRHRCHAGAHRPCPTAGGGEAAISNACFHGIDFAAALDLELPQFDYIVAHGVYTWIDPESQRVLRQFIDRRLKPGGLVYLSYNAMPGWARDLPFQRLVRELGLTFPGDNAARFAAAAGIIRALAAARVPALEASFTVRELDQRPEDYAPAYLVHEFMPAAWRPLYVTEVRAAMATIGLTPVGSATLSENLDWMVLDEAARKTLATISELDAPRAGPRLYLDQRFRCDVFARGNRRLGADERAGRIFSSTFALARPVPVIQYTTPTPAGPVLYDTPAARVIIDALTPVRAR